MTTPNEVLRRHRNLTTNLWTRVSTTMREELQRIADKSGTSLSDTSREAFAEFISNHKGGRRVKP